MISRYPSPTSSNKLKITEIKGITIEIIRRVIKYHHHFVGCIPDDMGVMEIAIHRTSGDLFKPEPGFSGEVCCGDGGFFRIVHINNDLVLTGKITIAHLIRGAFILRGFHDKAVHFRGPASEKIRAGAAIVVIIAGIARRVGPEIGFAQHVLDTKKDILACRKPQLVGNGNGEFVISLGGQTERGFVNGFPGDRVASSSSIRYSPPTAIGLPPAINPASSSRALIRPRRPSRLSD